MVKKRNKKEESDVVDEYPEMKNIHCELFNGHDIEVWILKFEATLKLNKIQNEDAKRDLFVNSLNLDILKILVNLCKPDPISNHSYESLYKILLKNFKPIKLKIAERVKFFSAKQNNLSILDFANNLKESVVDCVFPSEFYQDALITAFIMGLSDNNIRAKLLEREYSCFADAVELARMLFSVQSSIMTESPSQQEDTKVAALKLGPCFSCGERHLRSTCKFNKATCTRCGQKGHLAKVCRSERHAKGKQYVKSVDSEVQEEVMTVLANDCSQLNKSPGPIVIKLQINNQAVAMQLDTGSCVSLITDVIWKELGHFKLQSTQKQFSSYTGHKIIILGMQFVDVYFNNTSYRLPVYVSKGATMNLLGRDWAYHMNLLRQPLEKFIHYDISNVSTHVNLSESVNKLLVDYSCLFEHSDKTCSKFKAHLYLKPDTVPTFRKARPVPFALVDKVKQEINRLVAMDVLEPIDFSSWAAPCVVVRKPNDKIRLCGDFSTGLNQALEIQHFPLPTPNEIFIKLNQGDKFTTLDLTDAYLSVPIDEESQKLLVINTITGLYKYKRLCFGIAPAPSIFQKVMNNMLGGLPGVAFYLDDIIVTGRNDVEHLQNLKLVLQKIEEYGFKLNRNKCKFAQNSVEYLGHVISSKGIHTSESKVEAIINMPAPQNIKQLESFIGMMTYYSKFIPDFSNICKPLNNLRKKDILWFWSTSCEDAFQLLKKCLLQAPILAHYNPLLPIVVAADASSIGIGCCLFHRFPDGTERPVAFASKTLSKAESSYSQIEREALGIIYAIKKFRPYLAARHFVLQTDHRPLLTIFGSKKGIPVTTANRLQRWALQLNNFNFDVEYIPTGQFGKVDGLSRLPANDTEFNGNDFSDHNVIASVLNEVHLNIPITYKDISSGTHKDPILSKVYNYIHEGWPSKCDDPEIRPYFNKKDVLSLHEGCILYGIRVVIPAIFQPTVLDYLHEVHAGIVRMKSIAREKVWWPHLDKDIERVAHDCTSCNELARNEPQSSQLISWPQESKPWNRLHIDFAGPFMGKMFLLVVDAYSKWMEVVTMTNITASNTVRAMTQLFYRFGIPNIIVSDNGRSFTSQEFQNFCISLGIEHLTTPAYHPTSNGQVERYVGTFKSAIKKIRCSAANLLEEIQKFLFHYRTTPHSTTGLSPAELFLGRRLRTKLDLLQPQLKQEERWTGGNEKNKKDFGIGERVYWRDYRGDQPAWKKGTIKKRIGQNMWLVVTQEGTVKKHSDQLRKDRSTGKPA